MSEVAGPLAQRLGVETSPKGVGVDLGGEPAPVGPMVRQARTKTLDGVAEENQQTSLGGRLANSGGNPGEVQVVRRPLSGDLAGGAREPAVVLRGTPRTKGTSMKRSKK